MATAQQPPTATGPLLRKLKVKLPRRVAIALAVVLAGLMVAALAVPALAIILLLVLPACALLLLADSAAYWFKHRKTPRYYDDKGRLQPNKTEGLLLILFTYTPLWFWAALTDSVKLNLSFWIAGALMIPLYFLGKLVLFRCWLPFRERPAASTTATD